MLRKCGHVLLSCWHVGIRAEFGSANGEHCQQENGRHNPHKIEVIGCGTQYLCVSGGGCGGSGNFAFMSIGLFWRFGNH